MKPTKSIPTGCAIALISLWFLVTPQLAMAGGCEDAELLKDVRLYHGSPAPVFGWREGDDPPPPIAHSGNPDGPAWFAENDEFSLHAALRMSMKQDNLSLHVYRTTVSMSMLSCEDHHAFFQTTGLDEDEDIDVARAFCKE